MELIQKQKIKSLNPWWEQKSFRFNVISRPQYLDLFKEIEKKKNIFMLIGARRVGKTSIFKSLINHLLREKIPGRRIVYLTSEIRTQDKFQVDDFIIKYRREKRIKRILYLFIDEVQDLPDWQRAVKFLYDNFNIQIFITGSSSLILKPQTAKLTGRFSITEVLPLDFREYLDFKKKRLSKSSKKNQLLAEEYLKSGGYPEYVLKGEKEVLANTIESTMYRDLLQLYGIRNPIFLKNLLDYLTDKVTNPVSPHVVAKDLKVNDDTARFYLEYLMAVYLIYPVRKQGASHRITKGSLPKYYFNDTGILSLRSLKARIGHLAENAVYLKLRRMAVSAEYPEVYYYRDSEKEVDFTTRDNSVLYEVKYKDTILEEELINYRNLKSFNLIVPNQNVVGDFKFAYPELKIVDLWRFLSR